MLVNRTKTAFSKEMSGKTTLTAPAEEEEDK